MRVCVRLTVRLNHPSLARSLSLAFPPRLLSFSLALSLARSLARSLSLVRVCTHVRVCSGKKQAYDPLVLNIVAPIVGATAFILACAWCAHSHLKHTADNCEQE